MDGIINPVHRRQFLVQAWLLAVLLIVTVPRSSLALPPSLSSPRSGSHVSTVLVAGSVLGGLALVHVFDSDIRGRIDHEQRNFGRRDSFIYAAGGIEGLGVVAGGFYLGGLLGRSEEARQTSVTVAEAALINALLTQGLKGLVGRSRPLPREDPHFFQVFSGPGSFPSGHTSTAFSMAAVVTDHYPAWWVQVVSYGMAGTVGFSRMAQDAHWASDVASGAVLGILVGKTVSRWERQRRMSRFLYTDGRRLWITQRWG
ncbi:MAG: phosphatase PAP2 family protein [Elusimicrobia bacterium]|nr:phosphatase PAP2 family protein [Elusimicrobiota bacterium]